jgi:Mrp family chromosome partitioning ATPase
MRDDAFHRLGLRVLNRLPERAAGRAILVTSARDGEGKSFVAAALAEALVAQGAGPVALVRCSPDPRAPALPGWSDLLDSGQWQVGPASGSVSGPASGSGEAGPTVIGAGSRPRAAALFHAQAVANALDVLRSRFAIAVIDAPSLAACGALLRHADGSLLVINACSTRREVVIGTLAANPIPTDRLLGTVLNRQPAYVPNWLYRRIA